MALFGRKQRGEQVPEGPPAVVAALEDVWAIIQTEPYDNGWSRDAALGAVPSVAALLEAPQGERADALVALVQIAARPNPKPEGGPVGWGLFVMYVARRLGRRSVTLGPARIRAVLEAAIEAERISTEPFAGVRACWVIDPTIKFIEREAPEWSAGARATLLPLLEAAAEVIAGPVGRELSVRLTRVRQAGESSELPLHELDRTEDLGDQLASALEASPEPTDALAAVIEVIAALPASGKATARWTKPASAAISELNDPAALCAALIDGMLAAGNVVSHYEGTPSANSGATWERFSGDTNEAFALGVLRLAGIVADPTLLEPLRRTARHMLMVTGGGNESARSVKLANAAVVAIADSGLPSSITELLALERAVRHGGLLNQIRKSIDALAAAQGVTSDELLEQAVESHGLAADGTREVPLSVGAARIEVSSRAAVLAYVEPGGAVKKSFPADVKEADEDALDKLRTELKGIRKTVAGERHRLDGLLVASRSWPVDEWRRWYIEHPVTGRLTRELIWRFTDEGGTEVVGRPVDGTTLVTDAGTQSLIPAGATVRLWHPVTAPPTEVGAWRQHCLDHRVVQPVKQAFREVYLPTPAEHETRVYSNRFAAHVFRQVQARALMKGRGWKAPPLAWWDDGRDVGTATRRYEQAGLRVEFVYDPIEDIEPDGGDLFPLCSSDQVRFVADGAEDAMDLSAVPRVVFSEAMRDVDLFIGVTSIGADPEWEDRGEGAVAARLDQYWNAYSFGELSAAAEIRRELIAGLLPALAITDRCVLEERFLRVRGELRTYRIHLGSGNIQMEPNAEYLCIVRARSGPASKLFLPLDDDPVLTLILSKAFLLAADDQIKDETILSQIKRR